MDFMNQLGENALSDLKLVPTAINLVLTLILGKILAWHYLRFAQVLSNKRKFAQLFVFIAATTMMVISIVKTSLALSLGLVGALSIIRFRTPVKEPEDLAYLFLALATGIGLGADQRFVTCLMFFVIVVALAIFRRFQPAASEPRVLAHVQIPLENQGKDRLQVEEVLSGLLQAMNVGRNLINVRRTDLQDHAFSATMVLDLDDPTEMGKVMANVERAYAGATISLVETGHLE